MTSYKNDLCAPSFTHALPRVSPCLVHAQLINFEDEAEIIAFDG